VPVVLTPSVAPTEKSVRGGATKADKPPPRVFERPVVAHSTPPATHAGFAAQQPQLATQPGKPLDDTKRTELKPVDAAPAPVVKVVAPSQEATRAIQPPPPAAAEKPEKPEKGRGKSDEQQPPVVPPTPAVPPIPIVPEAPKPDVAPTKVPTHSPAALTPEKQGKDQRAQPAAPPSAQPQSLPPQAPPAPAAKAPVQNSKDEKKNMGGDQEPIIVPPAQTAQPHVKTPLPVPLDHAPAQRSKPDQREQVVTPPREPQRAAEPKVIAAPVAPQTPAPQVSPKRAAEPKPIPEQSAPQVTAPQVPPARSAQPTEAPAQVAPERQKPPEAAGQQQPKNDNNRKIERKKDCGDKENCEE